MCFKTLNFDRNNIALSYLKEVQLWYNYKIKVILNKYLKKKFLFKLLLKTKEIVLTFLFKNEKIKTQAVSSNNLNDDIKTIVSVIDVNTVIIKDTK